MVITAKDTRVPSGISMVQPFRLQQGILSQNYVLPLTDRAKERLQKCAPEYAKAGVIPLRLRDVRVYLLGTGIGLVCFEVELINPFSGGHVEVPAQVMIEGVGALCSPSDRGHVLKAVRLESREALETIAAGDEVLHRPDQGHRVSKLAGGETGERAGNVLEDIRRKAKGTIAFPHILGKRTLLELADALIGLQPIQSFLKPMEPDREHSRLFSFSAVQLPLGVTDADAARLSYVLAHKFTIDYAILDEHVETETIRPFANVFHCMATQGGAVAAVDNNTDYLKNNLSQAVERTYLPMALLARHEYLRLRHLTGAGEYPPEDTIQDDDEKHLVTLQKDLIDFRLWYRFSHVSDLSNHNLVFQQWRRALALDHMLDELSHDAAEGERVLLNIREHREQKARIAFHFLSALGIFFLLNEVIEVIARVFILPPSEVVAVVERTADLLGQPTKSQGFLPAVDALKSQLTQVVEDLRWIHSLELWAFVFATLVVAYAIWFILQYRKSPIGGE